MFHLKCIAVLACLSIGILIEGCELSEQQMQKDAMECVASHSDPGFMMAIATHMEDPDSMAKPDFICQYQKDIVNILECMKDKVGDCLPAMYKPVMEVLPSKERIADGLKFMCDHKEVLENKCMQDHVEEFAQCYMGKVTQLQTSLAQSGASDVKGAVCSVIRGEEQCLREHKGSCSDQFIELVITMLEKFFPMDTCSKSATNDLTNTVLGSILVHGQPLNSLKFKPSGYQQPYVIKN